MSRENARTLEILFFIISLGLISQEPTKLLVLAGGNAHVLKPTVTTILLLSVPMIYVSVLRIIDGGKFFINLFAGMVYFLNITRWINII